MSVESFTDYQADHLYVLVGTNPLPNYVAIKLLLSAGGHVYFIFSEQTELIKDRLKSQCKFEKEVSTDIQVPEYEGSKIHAQICASAAKIPIQGNKVGLFYTGGTKVMSVYAYKAIQETHPDAVFSYLEARQLAFVFEQAGLPSVTRPVGLSITPAIAEMLGLHGYVQTEARATPMAQQAASILVDYYLCYAQFWIRKATAAKANGLDGPVRKCGWRKWCDRSFNRITEKRMRTESARKQLNEELSRIELEKELSLLEEGDDRGSYDFSSLWGVCGTLGGFQQAHHFSDCIAAAYWLSGLWLEDYTLGAVEQVEDECSLGHTMLGVKIEDQSRSPQDQAKALRNFELDVVALKGYQLFVISCTTGDAKGALKQKLFEAYVRARQIGGDEARVALVSGAFPYNSNVNVDSYPDRIEDEIKESWCTEIKVFGIADLPQLPALLKQWFKPM